MPYSPFFLNKITECPVKNSLCLEHTLFEQNITVTSPGHLFSFFQTSETPENLLTMIAKTARGSFRRRGGLRHSASKAAFRTSGGCGRRPPAGRSGSCVRTSARRCTSGSCRKGRSEFGATRKVLTRKCLNLTKTP